MAQRLLPKTEVIGVAARQAKSLEKRLAEKKVKEQPEIVPSSQLNLF